MCALTVPATREFGHARAMIRVTRRGALQQAGAACMSAGALARLASAESTPNLRKITCLGDSMSDIHTLKDEAYPAWLSRYLAPIPVVSDGVEGNDVNAMLARCRPDGIHTWSRVHKPGSVTFVLAGINDIIFGGSSASEIAALLAELYGYLARHGSTVYPITILPWGKSPYFRREREDVRVALNRLILRHPHAVNAELTMGDGAHPPNLRHEFDNGDGLHPGNLIGPQMLSLTCTLALVPH
jgi:lysophospholipase L1-like esterase